MLDLDAYAYSNPWSTKSPKGKAALAMSAFMLAMISNNLWVHLSIFCVLGMVVVILAKIPLQYYIKLFRIPVSFLLLGVATMLVTISTSDEGLLWSVVLGKFHFGISPLTFPVVRELFGRCLATLSALYFLTLTVPLNQMIRLMKKIRIPVMIIELMVLMYRFIHVFLTSVQESVEALQLRNGFINGKTARKSVVLLMVMTYNKVMASYGDWLMVLETKNYNGNFHV